MPEPDSSPKTGAPGDEPLLQHPDGSLTRLPPPDPLTIMQRAIEKGIDAATLEKLVGLEERYRARRAAEEYADALADCQARLPAILKDAENSNTKKRYETLEAVNRAIVPHITQAGFSVSYGTEESKLPDHIRIVADVRHRAGHKERHALDVPLDGKGAKGGASAMNATQATGSTISYGRRYLLRMIFNLSTTDDDDGQGGNNPIGENDALQIKDLLEQCATAGIPQGMRSLKYYANNENATKVEDIPQRRADLVLTDLRRKLKEARAPKEAAN